MSWCEWSGLVAGTRVLICPGGDGPSLIDVTVLDSFGLPVVGETVYFDFDPACDACFCPPLSLTTDASGMVQLTPSGGLATVVAPECCDVVTTVTCLGVTIPWAGGGGTDDRPWFSFDYEADCLVGPSDLVILQADFMGPFACRSDFDGNGMVSAVDLSMFMVHVGHLCEPGQEEPDIVVFPPSMEFEVYEGGTDCQTLAIDNVGDATLEWSLGELCDWLTESPVSGSIPAGDGQAVDVCVDATSLPPGTYYCDIIIESNDPDTPFLTVPVTLEVLPLPDITVSSTYFYFELYQDDQECQVLTIGNVGSGTLTYTLAEACPWLSHDPTGGSVPPAGSDDVDICVDSTGLPPGNHTCAITLTSNDPDESPITIDVEMDVLPTPRIDVHPLTLEFELYPGQQDSSEFFVDNVGTAELLWDIVEACEWLWTNPTSGSTGVGGSVPVNVHVDATGLAPLEYGCDIIVESNDPYEDGDRAPTVQVTLTVLPAPDIEVTPPALSFTVLWSDLDCASPVIDNVGTLPLNWGASDACEWLGMTPDAGTVPAGGFQETEVCVTATDPPGYYTCDIEIASNDPIDPLVIVPVEMTILPAPGIGVDPDTLWIEVTEGSIECDSLVVTNTGYADLIGDAASSCGFMSVVPPSFISPQGDSQTLSVCIDAQTLTPGSYYCEVLITSNAATDPDVTVPVYVTVIPLAPDIEVTPTSLSFHIVGTETKQAELEIANVGALGLNWELTEACTWLTAGPDSGGVYPGGSQTINVTAHAPTLGTGVYLCDIDIASDDPDEPLVTVPVTLTVQRPHQLYSSIVWHDLGCMDKAFVCPAGDGSWFSASIRDDTNGPIPGAQVTVSFYGCLLCLCEPISGITDAAGIVDFPLQAGIDATAMTNCCTMTMTVTCGEMDLTDVRQWISPDLNGDCSTDEDDEPIFSSDFATDACRSDFDCNGIVDIVDFAIFVEHQGHACEPVSGVDEPELADMSMLEQNVPNPFNPTTRIAFTVAEPGQVVLAVYDASGRPVRKLVDALMAPQRHEVTWDGKDERGVDVGSGVYFYRLSVNGKLETKKMVLLK
jgi:hypothetical protein